jgi:hypothetical protein
MPLGNFDSGGELRIEIDKDFGAQPYAAGFERAIQILTKELAAAIGRLPAGQRPQQVNVTCGLTPVAGGGFAIAQKGADTAPLAVTILWRGSEEQGLLGSALAGVPVPAD